MSCSGRKTHFLTYIGRHTAFFSEKQNLDFNLIQQITA